MPLPAGDAKDQRPDWQQAVWALRVSPAGGVPWVSPRGAGHASDTQMFQERAAALRATVHRSPTPRALGADATRSPADQAATLHPLGFRTRLPHTRTWVSQGVTPALNGDTGARLEAPTRDHRLAWGPDGRAQRWLVGSAPAALERAEAAVSNACQRDAEALKPPRVHWHAHRVETPAGANAALAALAKPWTSHQVEVYTRIAHHHEAPPGRPRHPTPSPSLAWQLHAQIRAAPQQLASHQPQNACLVGGCHLEVSPWRALEVLAADKGPAQAEGGVRLLKDPRWLVSSWLVNKPCRIHGLLMVLPFALLVSAVTQRRGRHPWARPGETGPNQITQPTARPTWRWVFHRLEAIHRVRVTVPGQVHDLMEGLHEGPINLLRWCGDEVCRLYQISPG
jgi:hypothetical protein